MKILMVCLGNICRSPLAHGILEHKIAQLASSNPKKFAHWEVDSAGTINLHEGEKPDSRSISTAKNHGIDISHQRSRPFTPKDFAYFDKIFVMDASNYKDVLRLAKTESEAAKVAFIMNEVYPNENRAVPDPYFGTFGFEEVYQMLDKACDKIVLSI